MAGSGRVGQGRAVGPWPVGRPAGELLADALVATVADLYEPGEPNHIPAGWLQEFRAMVGAEPSLHGEYLKAAAASERALAAAIARRTGADQADLRPLVLAAVVVAAERAAILQWFRQAGRRAMRRLPSAGTLLLAQIRYRAKLLAGGRAVAIGVGLPVILLIASSTRQAHPGAADIAGYACFGLTLTAWNTYGLRLVAAREAGVLKRWRATRCPSGATSSAGSSPA